MNLTQKLTAAVGITLLFTSVVHAHDRRGGRDNGWRDGHSHYVEPKRSSARYRGGRRLADDRHWRRSQRAERRGYRAQERRGAFRSARRGRAISVWIDGNRFRFREPRRCR